MDAEQFAKQLQQAAGHAERGEWREAHALMEPLLDDPAVAPLDKSVVAINLSVVAERRGERLAALRWCDRAVGFEGDERTWAAEQRAALLVRLGRTSDAISAYRELAGRRGLDGETKARLEANIKLLEA